MYVTYMYCMYTYNAQTALICNVGDKKRYREQYKLVLLHEGVTA